MDFLISLIVAIISLYICTSNHHVVLKYMQPSRTLWAFPGQDLSQALVSKTSPESQKAGLRVNDWKNLDM